MRYPVLLTALALVFCLVTGSVTPTSMVMEDGTHHAMVAEPEPQQTIVPVPAATTSASADTDDEQEKIIMIIFGLHKDSAILESAEIWYGHPPNIGYQSGNFTTIIRAQNGTPLFTFDVWDPRYQLEQNGLMNELARHEQRENTAIDLGDEGEDDIDLPLIIPYHRDIQRVDLVDKKSGTLMLSVNISPAVDTFRSRFPRDPDMVERIPSRVPGARLPAVQPGTFLAVSGGLAIIILVMLIHLVRRP
jgi:hypothetical protein